MKAAALAALAVVAALAVLPAHAAKGPVKVTRVQVSAKEFWYALSRRAVVEGPAVVELVNFGEDDHDLRMRRIGGTRVYRWPDLQPGAYFDRELRLQPGRYKLWCGIANHEQLGMTAVLTVRKA